MARWILTVSAVLVATGAGWAGSYLFYSDNPQLLKGRDALSDLFLGLAVSTTRPVPSSWLVGACNNLGYRGA